MSVPVKKRVRAHYHVAFFDREWTHYPQADRMNLTAHDLFTLLEWWNGVQQKCARDNDVVLVGAQIYQFITIEVEYVES
jgi:hypothetical protein